MAEQRAIRPDTPSGAEEPSGVPSKRQKQPLLGGETYRGTAEEQKAKHEEFLQMLREWETEDPQYNEETLAWLTRVLDEDRPSYRKLFPGATP